MIMSENEGRMTDSIRSIQSKITSFRDARNWKQFHNPKDLAISISLEAAELLEIFQWSGNDTSASGKEDKIKEELADVMIYCGLLADNMGFDIGEIISEKIDANDRKYPVEKSYGRSDKYTAYLNDEEDEQE